MGKFRAFLSTQKFLPLVILGTLFLSLVIALNISQQRQESQSEAALEKGAFITSGLLPSSNTAKTGPENVMVTGLAPGVEYFIFVKGTYYIGPNNRRGDAQWHDTTPTNPGAYNDRYNVVAFNEQRLSAVNIQPTFNADHSYTFLVTANAAGTITMAATDINYSDNAGSLSYEVYNIVTPSITETVTPSPTETPTPTLTPTVTPTNTPTPSKTCTFVSDTSNTVVGGGNAVAAYNQDPTWTASISGATWIWSSYTVTDPHVQETKTFSKKFYVKLPVSQATLDIASDNNYAVSLNGVQLFSDTTDQLNSPTGNRTKEGQDAYPFTSNFKEGENTLSIAVTNLAISAGTAQDNPAGLLYKLTVIAADCGTNAPVPSTKLSLNLSLHGIGTAGDAANPGVGGNKNPKHPQREVTVQVFNAQNQIAVTKKGQVEYDQETGTFKGVVDLGSTITNGLYTIKVKSPQYLNTLVSGIQTFITGTTHQLPEVFMVNGDINNDNVLNILDYDILLGCYSDIAPPVSCVDNNAVMADLNDDGVVNQFDYNLFLRELTNVSGK